MFYHILISTEETDEVYEIDHEDLNYIKENMAKPYLQNKDFQVDGYFIEPSKVKRMIITTTGKASNYLREAKQSQVSPGVLYVYSRKECVFEIDDYKEDITREVFEEIKENITKNEEKTLKKSNDDSADSNEDTTIFLAYSYREDDDEFVSGFKELLENKGYKVIDGKADRLGSISDAIIEKIQISDIAVIVMTKRDKKENGKFTTAAWLLEEKGAAIAFDKDVAMFVEEGIDETDIGGLQGDAQRFHFTRNNFLKVVMKFVKILEVE